ncbi:sporulation protein [Tumebacillus permanentifrigoris]|uniref:SpoOM protein n=1 Tax=Tumebacillus permanentifrigoris TaxID=378543 RepID=A0A316DDA9_9BACL|nr:sporulation protein [Tumebacillus permanentifrigoris]PWK15512.1 SpoOM protein [Tumebacillus permanentifrigoris]
MSLLGRALASFGVGSAKVNTHLEYSQYRVGDEVRGVVHIQGGNLEQEVDEIYLYLLTTHTGHQDGEEKEITRIRLTESFTVAPNETKEIGFAFLLPENTPVTGDGRIVWVHTGLDIDNALDPSDDDRITILPAV